MHHLYFYRDIMGFALIQRYSPGVTAPARRPVYGWITPSYRADHGESLDAIQPLPDQTGLYDMATPDPDHQTLAQAVKRLPDAGITLDGTADHGVSEAICRPDPDGNKVERCRNRPEADWPRDSMGALRMTNTSLDPETLLAEACVADPLDARRRG